MKNLIDICNQHKITPNQAYLLYSIRDKITPCQINISQELRALQDNWITENNTLTAKSIVFLSQVDAVYSVKKKDKHVVLGPDYLTKINTYRELFPKGMLPSGQPSRAPIPELEKKFISFFATFPQYTWDDVMAATKRYLEEYIHSTYISTSSHFISKQDNQKVQTFKLAAYCDIVTSGEENNEPHYTVKMT